MPPVGNLRLRPPQPLNASFGPFYATGIPVACPVLNQAQNPWAFAGWQIYEVAEVSSLFPQPYYTGEDCLTLNVQRPADTKPDSKLPVLFWIYGGGLKAAPPRSTTSPMS